METILKKLKETVEDVEQSLIDDFECINDSDWINGWETNTDEGSIAFDIGYRNGVLYAIKLLKNNKKKSE
tara:strand:+ start:732 stop:941 length:210 start_codon:yes stop_codon:yes gene_type:complete